jgi:hypothetical protein
MSYNPNYLNNNSVDATVNEAYKMATGITDVENLTLKDIIDAGSTDGGALAGKKEQFTKALISLWARNLFTDTEATEADDPYYVDSRQWGAIVQMISAQAPEVQESHAWKEFVSGTSTVGSYTVYLPIVSTKYYGKSNSWELPITISYEQYADAFTGADGFNAFRAYVFVVLNNAIKKHRKDMNDANRNNFIGEKYAYASTVKTAGVSTVEITHVAAATDKITICGNEIEWVSSGATGAQINIPSSDTAAKEAAALVTYLNALTGTNGAAAYTYANTGAVITATQKTAAIYAPDFTVSVSDGATQTVSDVTEVTPNGSPKGIHVLKLRSMYNAEMNPASPVSSRAAFMADKECLRYMDRKIVEYAGYIKEQSALFNTDQLVKFVPNDRLVVEVLNYAAQAADSVLLSDTFHNELVSLPQYRPVSAWQGLGDGKIDNVGSYVSFDETSKIDVTVDDGTTNGKHVELSGIVAFIADKWAIMHTIRSERVAARNFDPEALDMYFYQFRDMYMNNLSLPAIVFVVD